MDLIRRRGCGWISTFEDFRREPAARIAAELQTFVPDAGASQYVAWMNCLRLLQPQVDQVVSHQQEARRYWTLLEYELPREAGRRPDVVALENGVVVVLEFKDKPVVEQADVDQVAAYARDLHSYHEGSHELDVVPVLVLTRYAGARSKVGEVLVCPPHDLHRLLVEQAARNLGQIIDGRAWLDAPYAPLPGLVEAARMLFRGLPLPRVKSAESARIPDVVDLLVELAHRAARQRSRTLVLLCGVPGAGKTLVGLQLAHDSRLEDLRTTSSKRGTPAVFLSGNGPLVEVLQDALHSTAFVQGVKKYREYYRYKRPDLTPTEHVLIFDEAQRAWDSVQMAQKHGDPISEPEAMLELAEGVPDWCMVLALVGTGQEIHKGEESGIGGWLDAVEKRASTWKVVGPPSIAVGNETLLDLSTTLRSHRAARVHEWVNGLLSLSDNTPHQLHEIARQLAEAGFCIYVTDQLEDAYRYVRERYEGQTEKRYGLLTSRYATNVRADGLDNRQYFMDRKKRLMVEKWFNCASDDPRSCCALNRPATEFECQGLELDFPIVCWGDDLLWDHDDWKVPRKVRAELKDARRVTLNAYRVLLTRGRDGMCIYAPSSVGAVHGLLQQAGAQRLRQILS